MGTSKPLTIWVDPYYIGLPWVDALRTKGHIIFWLGDSDHDILEAHLILGPTCARFVPGMEVYLESFIKGARKLRYPEKKENV